MPDDRAILIELAPAACPHCGGGLVALDSGYVTCERGDSGLYRARGSAGDAAQGRLWRSSLFDAGTGPALYDPRDESKGGA